VRARVRGRRRSIRSPTVSVGGGMRCEWHLGVTSRIKWPALAVLHFWDWPQGHEPVSASPVLRLRRFIPRMFTWVKPSVPLQAGFLSFGGVAFAERTRLCVVGRIGVPSIGLAARVSARNACFSDSWSTVACVLCGLSRLAPVRLWLADPPICLSDARNAPRRTPSSIAGGGRRLDRVCERK
jgi:hypothetical protein